MNTFFIFLLLLIILSSFKAIFSKNPVQSILFLVLIFCLVAQLIILLGVDFLALILIIVYVGAIAVLFLFVVMMLNIRIVELSETLNQYMLVVVFISLLIFVHIIFGFLSFNWNASYSNFNYIDWYEIFFSNTTLINLGTTLYTYYFIFLIFAGLLLLLAMISAIVLTLESVNNKNLSSSKKQSIASQVERSPLDLNFWKRT